MSFRTVKAQDVEALKPRELVVQQIVQRDPATGKTASPVLLVVHLGEGNGEFWSDALRRAGTRSSVGRRRTPTPAEIAQNRAENRADVARFAVKGLSGWFHDDGRAATMEDVQELIDSLPDGVFDSVLTFVVNPENFRAVPIEAADAKDVAGK